MSSPFLLLRAAERKVMRVNGSGLIAVDCMEVRFDKVWGFVRESGIDEVCENLEGAFKAEAINSEIGI